MLLMDTNGGKYAAACSLDFAKPPNYYDTFALRDSEGQSHAMQTWPYLKSYASRSAIIHNKDAVPVKSCWNGMGEYHPHLERHPLLPLLTRMFLSRHACRSLR